MSLIRENSSRLEKTSPDFQCGFRGSKANFRGEIQEYFSPRDPEEIPRVFFLSALAKEALPCEFLLGCIHALVGTGNEKDGHGTFEVWWDLG